MPIQRGDRLMLNQSGAQIPVEAAGDEHEGTVQIKYKGAVLTVNVRDVQRLDDASPPCPECGQ